jgi:hypothetical protein
MPKKKAVKKAATKKRIAATASAARQRLTDTEPEPGQTEDTMETGILSQPLNDSTDDVVAFEDAPVGAVATGDVLQIDDELMSVIDASDANNWKVERGAYGSTIAAHAVGTEVFIGITPPANGGAGVLSETQFVSLIAAIMYVRPGSQGLQECVDLARNLIANVESSQTPEPED